MGSMKLDLGREVAVSRTVHFVCEEEGLPSQFKHLTVSKAMGGLTFGKALPQHHSPIRIRTMLFMNLVCSFK